jgi:hypothetical protein
MRLFRGKLARWVAATGAVFGVAGVLALGSAVPAMAADSAPQPVAVQPTYPFNNGSAGGPSLVSYPTGQTCIRGHVDPAVYATGTMFTLPVKNRPTEYYWTSAMYGANTVGVIGINPDGAVHYDGSPNGARTAFVFGTCFNSPGTYVAPAVVTSTPTLQSVSLTGPVQLDPLQFVPLIAGVGILAFGVGAVVTGRA